MLITYSRISSILKMMLFCVQVTIVSIMTHFTKHHSMLVNNYRWRISGRNILTFMISKKIFNNYKDLIRLVGEKENDPFEKPLHEIYKKRFVYHLLIHWLIIYRDLYQQFKKTGVKTWNE